MTFVELVLGLVHAHDLQDFTKNIVNIEYGAVADQGYSVRQVISYENRNNFPDADFNPINQKSGLLTDVTESGPFSTIAKKVSATINWANWFAFQAKPDVIAGNVHIFNTESSQNAEAMADRFSNNYAGFFQEKTVVLPYIPK